jgi:cation/acetate symporter
MTAGVKSRRWQLHAVLLAVWFVFSFGVTFFARDLSFSLWGWPLHFWLAAQGSVLVFIAIVVVFAWRRNRFESLPSQASVVGHEQYRWRVHRRFAIYVCALLAFVASLAVAEQQGMPKAWVAGIFLSATLALYAAVGVYGRTADASEYYVAGRRIPAMYNGMATAADWMSAASFISLAGGLYLQGYSGSSFQAGGLAYILGWTGGFCLLALFVAPYLRQMGLYTVPDYFAVRYGGKWPRIIAAAAAVLCSFTYVVAQLYGVGLITSRLIGVHFEIGILLGLGGVLVCSFLGGMRAVTWTQVTQYVVIILAFLIPVSWLSYKQTGNPLAPLAYGQQLPKIAEMERVLRDSVQEKQVVAVYEQRATEIAVKLENVEAALQAERKQLRDSIRRLEAAHGNDAQAASLRRELAILPKDAVAAKDYWQRLLAENQTMAKGLSGMPSHMAAFAGDPSGDALQRADFENSRINFMALMFCLMVGTAGLPHLLTRYYTTASVAETRKSVAWSLIFIALLYISAPALAVLVKYEVMAHLVGQNFDQLPPWINQWARDASLLAVSDVNGDQKLQFGEIRMSADLIMLATPEIGGLPYVISVLVVAGGLAAALSTADGLLLTIGNALAHDLLHKGKVSKVEAMRRVMWSKFALLVVALVAAYTAAQRPAGILYLVSASFSLAGAAFVPAMVLGIFWKRTTHMGAILGMLTGLSFTIYYMLINQPVVRDVLGLQGSGLWWGIQPISAGVFGVTAGLLCTICVSLMTIQKPVSSAH